MLPLGNRDYQFFIIDEVCVLFVTLNLCNKQHDTM